MPRSDLPDFSYVGEYEYSLTCCTFNRHCWFTTPSIVDPACTQLLQIANEKRFEIPAYCFMPDHVHLVVDGRQDNADCKAYIKALKQYSNYYFKQARRETLFQRYGYERMIRTDVERALTIAYVVANSVVAGLVTRAEDYPFLGSEIYSLEDLLAIAESAST